MALTMLVIGLMACGFSTYADAQDGVKFGMGVELQNQPAALGDIFSTAAAMTPSFLFSIQVTPGIFIEPSIGFHRMSDSREIKPTPPSTFTSKWSESGSDLILGVGMIYALKPDAAVSPMFHPTIGIHMLKYAYEEPGVILGTVAKEDVSATAFQVGLGFGGLVNVKESLYLTAEARFTLTKVGDTAVEIPGYIDNEETSETMFDTDMVIGLRFVF